MKITKTAKIAVTTFIIFILVISAWQFYKLFDKNKTYETQLQFSNAKISLYSDTVTVLKQDTAKLLRRIDSFAKAAHETFLLHEAEIQKRLALEKEKEAAKEGIKNSSEPEQVKFFISYTGENYEPEIFKDKYLISFPSISYFNNIAIDYDFCIRNNLSLITDLEIRNKEILNKNGELKSFYTYREKTDKMLIMKNSIIAESNTKFYLQNGEIKKYKKQRNVSYGLTIALILIKSIF